MPVMVKPATRLLALLACLSLLVLLTGCSGRKLSTSVQDQVFVPGPKKEAKVEPPPPAELAPPPAALVPPPLPPAEAAPPRVALVPSPPPPAEPAPPSVALVPPPSAPVAPPLVPAAEPLVLSDVYFDYDQSMLRSDAKTVLEANARRLKADNSRTLLIEGHCDERGTVAYNLVLGEKRARMVKQYLEDLGIASSRIQMTSYGKEKPFCSAHSADCWQQNRRAHFVLQ